MRPAGTVRQTLLQAARSAEGKKLTLRELAASAGVRLELAAPTVKNMVRAGDLHVVGGRRVAYRNKPVAEYGIEAPAVPDCTAVQARGGAMAALAGCWTMQAA